MTDQTVAVVDVGSMTVRVTVISSGTAAATQRFSQPFITQLSDGIARTGQISAASLDATREALAQIRAICVERGATRIRAIGTEAARRASNRADLELLIKQELGVDLEVLSGEDEGRLSFTGGMTGLERDAEPISGSVLMIDIGGASTEFVVGVAGGSHSTTPESAFSADMGTVTFTNAYLASDPPRPDELSAALSVAELHLDDARRNTNGLDTTATAGLVVGVGGTITTAAAVEIGLEPYDADQIHGFVLTREAAEDVFRTLATESLADRLHNPGLSAKRAEVIVGGLCILVESFRQLGMESMVVSDRGVADGIAAEMLDP